MKKFTIREKADGALAVRDMSDKAQKFYSGTDMIAVIKYVDELETLAAEAKADAEGIDHMPGVLDVVRYALVWNGYATDGLTFEEIEREIESLADAYAEDEDDGTVTNAFGVEFASKITCCHNCINLWKSVDLLNYALFKLGVVFFCCVNIGKTKKNPYICLIRIS